MRRALLAILGIVWLAAGLASIATDIANAYFANHWQAVLFQVASR